jgi:hypothetical protein
MASVASQLIEEVTAHAQRDSLTDAREICADGTYFPNNLRTFRKFLSDSGFNLQGGGSDAFSVEGEVLSLQGNQFLWDGRLKSENVAVFRTLLDFLEENDRNEPLAGTPSLIPEQLENRSYCVMLTEYSDGCI